LARRERKTATDPAPLSMLETIIRLKPQSEWRPGLTRQALLADLDQRVQLPGLANTWTAPIRAACRYAGDRHTHRPSA